MDDGMSQEVCLHSTPDGHFFVELMSGSQRGWVPIDHAQLQEVLASRVVRIEGDSCLCEIAPEGETVSILVKGVAEVQFALAMNHFAALTKSLGLSPLNT